MRRIVFLTFLALSFPTVAAPPAAYAYLDPGTGSMVLQLLLGGAVGALAILKLYWSRLNPGSVHHQCAVGPR